MIYVNFYRPELEYIESVINVEFAFNPGAANLTLEYVPNGALHPSDGFADWVYESATKRLVSGNIQIEQDFHGQSYLFLHEIGHTLGLVEHRPGSPDQTLMFAGGGGYSRSFLDGVNEFGSMDIVDLWGIWGVSDDWKGMAKADHRDNVLYGGSGPVDAGDNSDLLAGGHGVDTIYGNAGDDTIFGGVDVFDPWDSGDVIYGGLGSDVIYGNGGDDTIWGNDGNDILFGGAGTDTFVFSRGSDIDVVVGYQSGESVLLQGLHPINQALVGGSLHIDFGSGDVIVFADYIGDVSLVYGG